MKNLKKVLALVLAVVMIMGVVTVASAKDYTDVKGTDNYADAIDALSSLKILDGFEDGTFKADGTLNRAQAAKIVAIVHNAATNGKIDADIADLYANAQNPFVDCNTSWALPYINYCRITGLADGMTATTYAPKRELTGVQWLKLMLTTLNFDTAKEGYTGTGWDINVLNRANEIGLTAGLADGWKAIAPIKRGEAAQILYNALTAYLVEYGQNIKGYVPPVAAGTFLTKAFVANESVASTGVTLGAKMGVKITRACDIFMRPGYKWAYGTWSAFYMDAPVATYTTATTMCDVLVDGAKIAKTSNKDANVYFFRNGYNDSFQAITANHKTNACTTTHLGGNGALTQVFKVSYVDGNATKTMYIVTVIDTFLAKVDKVAAAKHHTADVTTTTATLYAGANQKFSDHAGTLTIPYLSDYAKNDYVLLNIAISPSDYWVGTTDAANKLSLYADTALAYDNTNRAVYGVKTFNHGTITNVPNFKNNENVYVVAFQKAGTIAEATFSGQSNNGDTLTVNGTRTPANCTYTLTDILTPNYGNYYPDDILVGKKVTNFFTDQYGNVIGDYASSLTTFGIIDSLMWVNDGGLQADKYAEVKLIDADAKDSYVKMASYRGKGVVAATGNNAGTPYQSAAAGTTVSTVAQDETNNTTYTSAEYNYGVVSYSASEDKYSFTKPANMTQMTGHFDITSGKINVDGANYYYTNNDTKFVIRTKVAGQYVYTAYAGIDNLPTMSNVEAIVYVKDNATDTVASFVFMIADNAIFAGSDTLVYVANPNSFYAEAGDVYHYNVYVNGELTEIIATGDVLGSGKAQNLFDQGAGVYMLHFISGDKKVSSATKITGSTTGWVSGTVKAVAGNAMILDTNADYNLTDAKIYVVTEDGLTAGTADDISGAVLFKTVAGKDYKVDTLFVNP